MATLHRCEKCKELRLCDNHHIYYGFDEQTVWLCKKCHSIITSINSLYVNLLGFYKMSEKERILFRSYLFNDFLENNFILKNKKQKQKFILKVYKKYYK